MANNRTMLDMASNPARVALAHHWLTTMRGGEKVLAELAGLFADAPIYTLLARPDRLSPELASRELRTSWLQAFRAIPDLQRYTLPLLPPAARSLDARLHDVVICSDAANIKAIRTRPDALKICYCHSPMRYVWDLYREYLSAAGVLSRTGLRVFAPLLRHHDRKAARSVTAFVANSRCVAERIRRCYGRASVVIPPPIETRVPPAPDSPGEFYLVVSEHVAYKRNDLAIDACNRLRLPLVVIGAGPLLDDMQRLAGPTVRVIGWQSDEVVRDHMRRCRALLFCGYEDFGMVPVEAQAAGRPVIAYGKGGAMETVVDGRSGLFFARQEVDDLVDAIRRFEKTAVQWTPRRIHEHAQRFSIQRFRERFMRFHHWCLDRWRAGGPDSVRDELERDAPEVERQVWAGEQTGG